MKDFENTRIPGFILKKESIQTAASHIMPGTFVLKIGKPFPGMYRELTIRSIPEFYFLVLRESYSTEEIIRVSEDINKDCNYGFNAVAGEITVMDITYPVIRIKNIREEECIQELQREYLKHGFHFSKESRQIMSEGMVKIIKYFDLEKVEEGIWYDRNVNELGYFEIPRKISWDLFEEMTYRIKVNVALGIFDAATGIFRMDDGDINIVRIYNPSRSTGNLALIRKEYLAATRNPELTS